MKKILPERRNPRESFLRMLLNFDHETGIAIYLGVDAKNRVFIDRQRLDNPPNRILIGQATPDLIHTIQDRLDLLVSFVNQGANPCSSPLLANSTYRSM